jgi:hypothetical protein
MKKRIVLALVLVVALSGIAMAAPPERGLYTATIDPTEACAGEPTSYALTIKCTQLANQGLGSAVVQIPVGFSVVGGPTVASPWTVATVGATFVLTTDNDAYRLAVGESVTLNFTATAADPGLYTWTTSAYQSTNGTSDAQYSISGPQPTVEVISCPQEKQGAWCSPGFWKNAAAGAWALVGKSASDLFDGFVYDYWFGNSLPGITLGTVLNDPPTYSGPPVAGTSGYALNAFNATGAALTNLIPGYQFDWDVMVAGGEDACPIDHFGDF